MLHLHQVVWSLRQKQNVKLICNGFRILLRPESTSNYTTKAKKYAESPMWFHWQIKKIDFSGSTGQQVINLCIKKQCSFPTENTNKNPHKRNPWLSIIDHIHMIPFIHIHITAPFAGIILKAHEISSTIDNSLWPYAHWEKCQQDVHSTNQNFHSVSVICQSNRYERYTVTHMIEPLDYYYYWITLSWDIFNFPLLIEAGLNWINNSKVNNGESYYM